MHVSLPPHNPPPAWSDSVSLFSSGGVPLQSVCVQQGQLSRQGQSREHTHNVAPGDFGGTHRYELHDRQKTLAVPHMNLAVVAWFSCEGNLNHLVGETLVPVWELLQQLRPATPPRLIIAGRSPWPIDNKDPQTCHSERYAYIASLLPVQPHVLFVGGAFPRRLATAYDLRTRRAVAAPRHECYNTTVQVKPSFKSSTGSQDFYAAVLGGQCSKPSSLEVLVVERNRTRRLVNQPELLSTLRALPGVDAARAVDLERLDAAAQLQTVCAHRVLVGVHGQGMEWGHSLNGVDPSGSALIEFWAGDWPCYYAQRMAGSGMISECQEHTPVDGVKGPAAKEKDVQVDLNKFACGAKRILCRLNPSAYHVPAMKDKEALRAACNAACPRSSAHAYPHVQRKFKAPAISHWVETVSAHGERAARRAHAVDGQPNSTLSAAVVPSVASHLSRTAPQNQPRRALRWGKKITAFALLYAPALACAGVMMFIWAALLR